MVDNTNKEYLNRDCINHKRRIIGDGELSKDCHKSLNTKEGVSKLLLFWLYHVQIYNWFTFYECRASVNRLFTSEADNSFQEWHKKENVWIIMFFSRILLCLLHLSTCLTGRVYDQELGLYWLNRVETPLLNQIPWGSLICTASVNFVSGIVPLASSFACF